MSKADSTVFGQIKTLRKELTEKQTRVREELASAGHDPKRLSPHNRRSFADAGIGLRLLDDLEAQMISGTIDDLAVTISHLLALLKQLQTAALPGNATPAQGLPITPRPGSGIRPAAKTR